MKDFVTTPALTALDYAGALRDAACAIYQDYCKEEGIQNFFGRLELPDNHLVAYWMRLQSCLPVPLRVYYSLYLPYDLSYHAIVRKGWSKTSTCVMVINHEHVIHSMPICAIGEYDRRFPKIQGKWFIPESVEHINQVLTEHLVNALPPIEAISLIEALGNDDSIFRLKAPQ